MTYYESCPSCGAKICQREYKKTTLVECGKCEAVYGNCYLGDSYSVVSNRWADVSTPAENERYFDFTCLGSAGITRRHGWYDPGSKRITQTG